jgi:hypothetical protein
MRKIEKVIKLVKIAGQPHMPGGTQVWWFLGPDTVQDKRNLLHVYRPPMPNVLLWALVHLVLGFHGFCRNGARDLWILNSVTNNPTELDRKKERKN